MKITDYELNMLERIIRDNKLSIREQGDLQNFMAKLWEIKEVQDAKGV